MLFRSKNPQSPEENPQNPTQKTPQNHTFQKKSK
jgi:hypothetical protein